MAVNYRLSNIRALLTEGFTAEELRRFCYDTPEFRAVYDQLAANTGKADIIDRLLEHAERKGKLEAVLLWAKAASPAKYAEHQPYELPTLASSPPASSPPTSSPLPRPLRVFLCHAAADKPIVRDLYQRLSQEGFIQPWLDEEELLPGQDWQLEIPKAVRASDVVLVCLSPQSITKAGYVQKEIKFALDIADEQPEGTIFLIPLRLEVCDVPQRLRKWHWANLFEVKGYDRLLRALRLRAEAINVTLRPQAEESPPSPVIPESPRPIAAPSPSEAQVVSTPPPEKSPANRGMLHFVQRDMEAATPASTDRVIITHPFHLELVRVPAGEFLMGSDPVKDKDAQPREQPQHRVYVSEFYIGKYPVTNEQYAVFVKAMKNRAPYFWEEEKMPTDKENHPVIGVSWNDAVTFCDWLSQASGHAFRLPTEAEWEKAARGTDGRIYPWGNEWDKTRLNSADGGPGDTTPVDRYSPGGDSFYGTTDMCGNVWEWCADWYDKEAYQQRAKTVVQDPTGPEKDVARVLRGGAFVGAASWVRCAARDWHNPDGRLRYLGLRVVGGGPFLSGL